jgi:hypothetical protein
MAEETVFRGVIIFLDRIGIYDVILPFLLIFTIMFAILEKTKVLGMEKIEGKEFTKKNLNAMVAFIVSFLVIASTKLVSVINETMSHVVLLLILVVSFMLLVGVFFGSEEFTLEKYPGWIKFFMVLMFAGIVLIFLNALDWLKYAAFLFVNWNAEWAATIILFIIVIGFMVFITWEKKPKKESK